MSLKYLGDTLDIHGGGQDLVFPHHENEIAQSEAFTGVAPFVKYWLHNGLMQLGEEKMSKSLGNLITVKEALERYSADAIRLFVISSHYRSPLTYSEEGLEAAHRGAVRLRLAAHRQGGDGPAAIDVSVYRQRFTEAMDDDFNTAQAIAALFDLATEINRAADEGHSFEEAQKEMIELAGIMGLTFKAYRFSVDVHEVMVVADRAGITVQKGVEGEMEDETQRAISYIDLLVEKRDELRLKRQWDLADKIRAELGELGIVLEDTPEGTVWRYKR
jgi:cysteinyl-tRNA synthetase